jgi:flagellin
MAEKIQGGSKMSNLVVQTNVLALNSHRNLKVIGGKQAQASGRLSSGYRINSAADDASGLAISEKMRAQIRGLDMASKNTQDGISLIQTAEGGMQEIDNMLQRVRELSVQASNDTNDWSTNDRKKIQDEISQLIDGIDKMSEQVEFNAKTLLNGEVMDQSTKAKILGEISSKLVNAAGYMSFANTADLVSAVVCEKAGLLGGQLGISGLSASIAASSFTFARTVMGAGTTTVEQCATFSIDPAAAGAWTAISSAHMLSAQAMEDYIKGIDDYITKLEAATAYINAGSQTDGDVAAVAENLTAAKNAKDAVMKVFSGLEVEKAHVLSYTAVNDTNGNGLWFQTGANSTQGIQVGIGRINTDVLGIGDGKGTALIDVNKAKGSEISAFIDVVNESLQYVTSQRALLGAVQNRLEYTKASLEITSENLSASESRIRDADMAKEMMKLTAANVLQQAGVSMLSQANQAPQSVLQLLQ